MRFAKIKFGLKAKFVVLISMLILFTSVILSGFLIEKQSQLIKEELEKRVNSLVKNLAYNCEYGVLVENSQLLTNLLKGVLRDEDLMYATVYDNNGKVLAQLTQKKHWQRSKRSEGVINSNDYQTKGPCHQCHLTSDGKYELLELTYPIMTTRIQMPREELGNIWDNDLNQPQSQEKIGLAKVGVSLRPMRAQIARMKNIIVLLTLLIVGLAILFTFGLVNLIIKPIEKLVKATRKIAQGCLSFSVDIQRKDELGELASAFNQMTASLKESRSEIEDYSRTLEHKVEERTRELKEAQAKLIQTEKMAAVGQLAAGVAHELNNPLGGILGFAQYASSKIRNKKANDLTDEDLFSYSTYLKDIEQQSMRCKRIVQNLLKFSRTSKKVDFEILDLNNILEDTLMFVQHQLSMNKVRLSKSLESSLPKVNGNSGMLQQVFTNIILNALQAMPQGGSLSVSTKSSSYSQEAKKGVEVVFTDSGCGIPAENLEKIFEPFFTTKKVGQGTGLGLSVSYGIIKEHKGDIKVQTELGKGTSFIISLPALPAEDKKPSGKEIKSFADKQNG